MLRTLTLRLATLAAAAWLALTPARAEAQKALVYCPVGIDATGCNAIVTALTANTALFPDGVDAGYDGTSGTVDLAGADLSGYSVFVVPSLADGADVQPYALLRNATIAARLQSAFIGRVAVWSGTPDVGSTNRSAKDGLLRNLAAWARPDAAGTHGPGVVALQDNSDDPAARYGWLSGISQMTVTADNTLEVYSNVQVLTTTGQAILTNSGGLQIGYTNMASYGLVRATAGADDATGGRSTRVVLVTMQGEPSDPNIATVRTDREDYSPRDTVTITGAGWTPGETVSLHIQADTVPLIHPDVTYSAVADTNGFILNQEFILTDDDLGVRFTLTATGQASGKTAQATFTDAPRNGSVTVSSQTGAPVYGTSSSATYTVTPTRSANGTVNDTLSVISGLPAGVTAAFTPDATFNANGGTAFPSRTLTLTTSVSTAPGVYTFTVQVKDGGDVATGTGTLTIAAKALTGSITAANKTYDATTAATILTRTLTGVVGADVVSLTGGTATFATKTVGNAKTVTATGLSLTGADAAKYTLVSTTATTTANITVATLVGAFTAANKTYDGTTAATIVTRTLTGVQGTDAVTLTGGTATFADKSPGVAKTVTGSGFSLSGADASNYVLASTTLTTTADIAAASLTPSITASSKVYDATTAAVILTRSLAGIQGTDAVTLTGGTATFADKNVGAGKTVTGSSFTLAGADAGNYVLNPLTASTTANITAATVTGQFTVNNREYDGTAAASIATRTLTGVIGADVVSLNGGAATFADKNVGAGKTVTGTGFTLGGADAGNYLLASTTLTTTADITAKSLTPSITVSNKVYDATADASILTRTLTGVIGGETVTLSGGSASFADKNVGTGKTVTGSGFTLAGADAGNYVLNPLTATTTANITAATVTGQFTASSKQYDGTTAATIATRSVTGVLGTDDVTLTGGTATFPDKHVGTGKTVTGLGFTLGGTDGGNYVLASTILTTTADITAATLTGHFTADSKVYDATTTATILTRTLTGAVGGDVVSLTGGTATFDTKNVGTGKTVTGTGLTLAGADAGNYVLASTTLTTTADITAATVAGTITADNKVYDGTTAATLATRTLSGVLGTDDVTLTGGSSAFADKNVGTAKTVTATGLTLAGTDAGNYALASSTLTTTADITARTLTVTATASNKVYDATTVATVTLSDDKVSGDAVTVSYTNADFDTKHAGTGKTVTVSGLVLSGGDAGNYALASTSVTTTADITPASLTPHITASNKVYDGTADASILTRTLTGILGTDDVSLTGGTATFANKSVGAGKTVTGTDFTLSGADAGNYVLAPATATTTADITERTLTVTATADDKVYDGTTAATVHLADDRISGDVFAVNHTGAAFDTKNAGAGKTVTVTGISIGSGADAGNYQLGNTTATATGSITPKAVAPHITANDRVYDGTIAAVIATRTLTGVISPDAVILDGGTATFANKNVGTGKTVTGTGFTLGGTDAGNYELDPTTATTTADITTRSLAVTATGENKVYDGTTDATVTLQDDRIAGDLITVAYATATFDTKNVGTGKTVSVSGINIGGGADAGNYQLGNSTATTTANITSKDLTPAITATNKTYDGTTAATIATRTLTGVIAPDAVTLTGGTATFADKNVGTNKTVTGSGFALAGGDAGNYVLNPTSAATTADITTRTLVVTATGVNKVYDGTTDAAVTLSDDRVSGDVFTDSYTAATFANKNVGIGVAITVSGISISGTDAGNYNLAGTTANATANITAATLTGHFTASDKAYDATAAASILSRTLTGIIAPDVVTLNGGSASFADKNVGTNKPVTGTAFTLGGADAGNYQLASTTLTTTASITQRDLAVTAAGVNKVYDGTTAATVTLSDDRLSGDVLNDSYAGATFDTKNAGSGKTVSVSGIAISGTDAGNYHLTNTTATSTANITVATATGHFTASTKEYDGTTAAAILSRTLTGIFGTDAVSLVGGSATFSDKNAGNGKTVTGTGFSITGGDAGNYVLASSTLTTTADITQRPFAVAADPKSKVFATGDPALTYHVVSGTLVAGDGLTGALSRMPGEAVGSYQILQNTLTLGGNYNLAYTPANLTIGSWSLTGFYQPVDMPTGGMVLNSIKGGQTVPLKFEIFAGAVEKTDVSAVQSFVLNEVSCPTTPTIDEIELTSTGGTVLRYDGPAGQFIQNWQTPKTAGKCYKVTMTAADAVSKLIAYFKTK